MRGALLPVRPAFAKGAEGKSASSARSLMERAAALLARKSRQRVRLVECAWNLIEQTTQRREMFPHAANEWPL